MPNDRNPVPWRVIASWNCITCGECCKLFTVNIGFTEWSQIIKRYGSKVVKPGLNEFYLRKRLNGRCVFQYRIGDHWICGLQHMKPKVCKLWPFKINIKPLYGWKDEALFLFKGKPLYIYIDPRCPAVLWGKPSVELINKILPEFIEITYSEIENQLYSTSGSILPFRHIVVHSS